MLNILVLEDILKENEITMLYNNDKLKDLIEACKD